MFQGFVDDLLHDFDERISVKTGWGYLEVKRIIRESVITAYKNYSPEVIKEEFGLYRTRRRGKVREGAS